MTENNFNISGFLLCSTRVFHEWLLWLFRYLRVMRLNGRVGNGNGRRVRKQKGVENLWCLS